MIGAASRGSLECSFTCRATVSVMRRGMPRSSRQMARLEPGVTVAVRSSAQPWIFNGTGRHVLTPVEVDTGVGTDRQPSASTKTRRRVARGTSTAASIDAPNAEAAAIRASGAKVVVGDIPPLAFEAAARAGVPSIALGNFTWDWIYEGYSSFATFAPEAIRINPAGLREVHTRTQASAARRIRAHETGDPRHPAHRAARRGGRAKKPGPLLNLGTDTVVALASLQADTGVGSASTLTSHDRADSRFW